MNIGNRFGHFPWRKYPPTYTTDILPSRTYFTVGPQRKFSNCVNLFFVPCSASVPSIYSKVEVLQGGEICSKRMEELKYQVFCSSVRGY